MNMWHDDTTQFLRNLFNLLTTAHTFGNPVHDKKNKEQALFGGTQV